METHEVNRHFMVTGPESSGTHYAMDLVRRNVPAGTLVWHRSFPMTPDTDNLETQWWPNLEHWCGRMGGEVVVILCFRHLTPTLRSRVQRGFSPDLADSVRKVKKAWAMLGVFMAYTKRPYVVCTYEGLATKGGRQAFLGELGLELKNDWDYHDANEKYWSTDAVQHPGVDEPQRA